MKRITQSQLRKILIRELRYVNEARPGEIRNLPGALMKIYELFSNNLNFPPQMGGFPAELGSLMDECGLSESQKQQVSEAYRSR